MAVEDVKVEVAQGMLRANAEKAVVVDLVVEGADDALPSTVKAGAAEEAVEAGQNSLSSVSFGPPCPGNICHVPLAVSKKDVWTSACSISAVQQGQCLECFEWRK